MIRLFLPVIFGLMTTLANAGCNFLTADYITELDDPSSIKMIQVEVPKSAKFSRNLVKILVSESNNIPPKLKKKFRATVIVHYEFGTCSYKASVKQNGDWKDHIKLAKGGKPLRSLNVKLKEGNVLNSIKFKLLLPETRGNLNEVLGTVFMRNLGFISPETFQVKTLVNGSSAMMLFQEDSRKELIEKNNRREGPLFEGDEELIWSYKDFDNFTLEPLVLARVTNSSWFLKGDNSQYITLSAYSNLQHAYLNYAEHRETRSKAIIFPNNRVSNIFQDYFFILIAMHGSHALIPNNRRYYFNSFSRIFEPIYYDGDLVLHKNIVLNSKQSAEKLAYAFESGYSFPHVEKFSDPKFINDSLRDFKERVIVSDNDAKIFFNKAMLTVIKNIRAIQVKLENVVAITDGTQNVTTSINSYFKTLRSLNFEQKSITSLEKNSVGFEAIGQSGKGLSLTSPEVATLISDNELQGERYVYLPSKPFTDKNLPLNVKTSSKLGGSILRSKGLVIQIDNENQKITMTQRAPTDWILFREANLSGWTLNFKGLKSVIPSGDTQGQRFNSSGMTGCLNFYKTTFKGTNILMQDGACEDSVNIVHSNGHINKIQVHRAKADAIDMDFSDIEIENVEVSGAGNDCIDVSGGTYSLGEVKIFKCGDKGISVGEKATLIARNVSIKVALLGVSSKDLSDTVIRNATFWETAICYEVVQKKQEFGGARLRFGSLSCKGRAVIDRNSLLGWL